MQCNHITNNWCTYWYWSSVHCSVPVDVRVSCHWSAVSFSAVYISQSNRQSLDKIILQQIEAIWRQNMAFIQCIVFGWKKRMHINRAKCRQISKTLNIIRLWEKQWVKQRCSVYVAGCGARIQCLIIFLWWWLIGEMRKYISSYFCSIISHTNCSVL